MVLPLRQTCPKCGTEFMGSDIVGLPCFGCQAVESKEDILGRPLSDEEALAVRAGAMISTTPKFEI